MSFVALFLIVAYVLFFTRRYGRKLALAGALLLVLAMPSITLYTYSPLQVVHFGVAPPSPTVTLVVLLAAALAVSLVAAGESAGVGPRILVLGTLLLVLILVQWGRQPQQYSGALLLLVATACYGCGRWIARQPEADTTRLLTTTASAAIVVHAAAALVQSAGIALTWPGAPNALDWIAEGRMVGLYDHPSTLGKTTFLLLAILLPATTSADGMTRRLGYLGVIAGVLGSLLTLSRANTAAMLVAIALFVLLQRSRRQGLTQYAAVVVGCGFAVASRSLLEALTARQRDDPTGGYREYLLNIGLHQIEQAPWLGIGPNFYSEHVGRYDHFAAQGFPVHNSFLLYAAELGIPLAMLFFSPLIVTIVNSIRRLRTWGRSDARALTLVVMLPGLGFMTFTGWGMDSIDTLPLWFFVFGCLGASVTETATDPPSETATEQLVRPGLGRARL